jgi:hypothetical protein
MRVLIRKLRTLARILRPPKPPLSKEQLAVRAAWRRRFLCEAANAIGFCLLVGGIAAYDWRVAMIFAGGILQVTSIATTLMMFFTLRKRT